MKQSKQLDTLVRKDVRSYNLNINEFSTLELLYHKGPQTIQHIKNKILIASSSLTYVIDRLEHKRLVNRQIDINDKRVTYIHLTSYGENIIKTYFPEHTKSITNHFQKLTIEELDTLRTLLKKI